MELIEGATLRALCGEPLPPPRVLHLGSQFLRALAFAHDCGIIHRDFKPENVMVRPAGYLKVLDLGLACSSVPGEGESNSSSAPGLPAGTLRYMSPEQCRGEKLTPASNVFAAGVVLYELLAGVHPFCGESAFDTTYAIANTEAPPLGHAPPALRELVGRMLAKNPKSRPTANEAAGAVTREANASRSLPSRARHSWIALAAPAAILLAAAVIAWALRPHTAHTERMGRAPAALTVTPLANLLGAERQPSVSADGKRVVFAFTEDRSTASHIYLKSIADGRLTRLTADVLPDFHPAFSPDGAQVAFLRRAGGRYWVMVRSSEPGGKERQIGEVEYTVAPFSLMTWHPDGRHLLVADALSETLPPAVFSCWNWRVGSRSDSRVPGLPI